MLEFRSFFAPHDTVNRNLCPIVYIIVYMMGHLRLNVKIDLPAL